MELSRQFLTQTDISSGDLLESLHLCVSVGAAFWTKLTTSSPPRCQATCREKTHFSYINFYSYAKLAEGRWGEVIYVCVVLCVWYGGMDRTLQGLATEEGTIVMDDSATCIISRLGWFLACR